MTSLSPSAQTHNGSNPKISGGAAPPHIKHLIFTCDFRELFHNLILSFVFWDGANKEAVVSHRYADSDVLPWADLVVVILSKPDKEHCYHQSLCGQTLL